MVHCPFAVRAPIPEVYLPRRADGMRVLKVEHNRMNIHITAATYAEPTGPRAYFSTPGKASSEFFTDFDGTLFQFGDSDLEFEADLAGNNATHSVENEGLNGPFTPAQVAKDALLFAWLVDTYGIANRIATSSHVGAPSKGLSWHRLGIDGNFPALPDPRAGRLQRGGGMRYSNSRGKACPTDAVILRDIFEIYRQAQSHLGQPAPGPASPPYVPPVNPPPSASVGKRAPVIPDAINRGDAGRLVGLAQNILRQAGFYKGLLDDSFGPKMQLATKNYQASRRIGVDGAIWKESWATLLLEQGDLSRGDVGHEVSLWQVYLGWPLGTIGNDRRFGPATDARTREVQRYLSIRSDGSVWHETSAALKR